MTSQATKIPQCKVRILVDADIEACEEIYRLNEPTHFPSGYFPKFSEWLRNRRSLVLVVEQDGAIRAFGGINAQDQNGYFFSALSFGMVHPEFHRTGFGTVLLLARLSLLKTGRPVSLVTLTTTGGSDTFYGRFGFKFVRAVQATPEYLEQHYVVSVSTQDTALCLNALKAVWTLPDPDDIEMPDFASLFAQTAVATTP